MPWKAETMARRRYQEGSIRERGDSWEIRWKEDVEKNGVIERIHRSKSISKAEFPTKSLAKRERDRILEEAGVKSETYFPSRLGSFDDFAKRWITDVVATMSPSTQSGFKSELKAWNQALRVEKNGEPVSMPMRELDGGVIQSVITQWHTGTRLKQAGPKAIKNRVGTLRNAWKWALEWNFTRMQFPANLRLPFWDKDEAKAKRPAYGMETAKQIIAEAEYPYNLLWWLTYELHVRRGEICGLDVGHVNLTKREVTIRRNRVMSAVKCTKARKARVFGISPELCEALQPLVSGRKPSEPLFLSPEGMRLHPENLVKRKLNPLLQKLGLKVKGTALHGLRHGAATELDRMKVPMATRMNRLGHSDEPTTFLYTHAAGEDDVKVAAAFGKELSKAFTQSCTQQQDGSGGDEEMLLGTA
jgi:integrase